MKKLFAMMMAVTMMMTLSTVAFAKDHKLTLAQAKQAALDYAEVEEAEAIFTKAHKDYDDGRMVYEIEFYVDDTEFDMDVDANTGRITDFSTEYHGRYNRPQTNTQRGYGSYDYDDDWDDTFDDVDDFFDWFD